MTLLGGLLPGLRDLRAPLAAGYLWLLLLWLMFADKFPTSRESADAPLVEVYRLGEAFGVVGIAAALSFAAYLLGLFSVALFVTLGRGMAWVLTRLFSKVMQFGNYIFGWAVSKRGYSEGLQTLAGFGNKLWRVEYETTQLVRGQRVQGAARKMAVRLLSRRFRRDEQFRQGLTDAFPRQAIDALIKEFQRTNIGAASKWYREQVRAISNQREGKATESVLDGDEEALEDVLFTRFLALAAWNREAAEFLLDAAIEGSSSSLAAIVDLEHDLRIAPARLAVSAPPAYERWDRLSGESEFRLAVVPPIVGLLLVARLENWINAPLSLGVLTAACTLLMLGLVNARRAHEQLEVAIEANVIESRAFQELATIKTFFNEGPATVVIADDD